MHYVILLLVILLPLLSSASRHPFNHRRHDHAHPKVSRDDQLSVRICPQPDGIGKCQTITTYPLQCVNLDANRYYKSPLWVVPDPGVQCWFYTTDGATCWSYAQYTGGDSQGEYEYFSGNDNNVGPKAGVVKKAFNSYRCDFIDRPPPKCIRDDGSLANAHEGE